MIFKIASPFLLVISASTLSVQVLMPPQSKQDQQLTWIIHGVAVKVAESHIVTIF